MNILILNRLRLSKTNYADWLGKDINIYMINLPIAMDCALSVLKQTENIKSMVLIKDNFCGHSLAIEAYKILESVSIDRILAFSEADLITAAKLREHFSIPGQNVESAIAYRDKVIMKAIVEKKGIPVPVFRSINYAIELVNFLKESSGSLVVKPRQNMGSSGVTKISSNEDIEKYLQYCDDNDHDLNLLAEEYCDFNQQYHVNGLVKNGTIALINANVTTPLLGFRVGTPRFDRMIFPSESGYNELIRFTESVLSALPTPETTLFHCEIFKANDGTLLLNEIASRVPGGKILDTLNLAYEFSLVHAAAAWQCNVEGPLNFSDSPRQYTGCVTFPRIHAVVKKIPNECPLTPVLYYELKAKVGDTLQPANGTNDRFAAMIVQGESPSNLEQNMEEASRWFLKNSSIL